MCLLNVLPDELVASILQLACQPGTWFGEQQARQQYHLALTCTTFARLLRQPLPVYASLEVDTRTLDRQCSLTHNSCAYTTTALQSCSSWLLAGRCLAVSNLLLTSLYADAAASLLQPVGLGLKNLSVSAIPGFQAQDCLKVVASNCSALTALEWHIKVGPSSPPMRLAPLSGLSILSDLGIDALHISDLGQSGQYLPTLTSLVLTLTSQCSLHGLASMSKLQALALMLVEYSQDNELITIFPSFLHLSLLFLGGFGIPLTLGDLDLSMPQGIGSFLLVQPLLDQHWQQGPGKHVHHKPLWR